MIVLGVDPGTAATGYGVVVRADGGAVSLRECGVIRTDAAAPLAERLRDIHQGVAEVIARHAPDVVAIEDVYYGRNVRSTVTLGHARAAAMLAAALGGVRVAEYSPSAVKSAIVGHGRATKEQVQYMVQRLLHLKEAPRPHDAADGVAVALCHCGSGPAAIARERIPSDADLLRRAVGYQP